MKKTLFIFSIILFFVFGNYLFLEKNAVGAIIDFETYPAGPPGPSDQDIVNTQYQTLGVIFSTNVFFPRIEQVGGVDPMPGFINDFNLTSGMTKEFYEDTEDANFPGGLGDYFLRLNAASLLTGTVPNLNIEYTNPVSGASAEIWDIDANQGTERWIVLAFDQPGNIIDSVVSPLGLPASDLNSLDGKPWEWSFNHANFDIYSIQIVWDGSPGSKTSGIGLAFDNFEYTAVPIPGAIWLFGSGILGMVFIRRKLKN